MTNSDESGRGPDAGQKGFALSPALAASVALVVAVFASVGVTGDYLIRAIRGHPVWMVGAILGALLAVVLMIAASTKNLWIRIGTVFLNGALAVAVFAGEFSVRDREEPHVVMSTESGGNNTLRVAVDASGAGLGPIDEMLVQVLGFETRDNFVDKIDYCETNRILDAQLSGGKLLAWQRSGPDTKGDVRQSMKFEVGSGKYAVICAMAVLKDKHQNPRPHEAREAAAYLFQ
jgi:hypothetical protein